MKKHTVNLKYFFIPLVLIIAAAAIEKFKLQPANSHIDTKHFTEILAQKEKKLNKVLSNIKQQIDPHVDSNSVNMFEIISNKNQNELDEQGFIIAAYINDSLRYWTDNSIHINNYYSKSTALSLSSWTGTS